MVREADLKLVEDYISSGTSSLVLGPNFSSGSTSISGAQIPDFYNFSAELCKRSGVSLDEFASEKEAIDYLSRTPAKSNEIRAYMRQCFSVRVPRSDISILPRLVWRRLYSYDLSDAIDMAYRRQTSSQTVRAVSVMASISSLRAARDVVELVKLSGDGLTDSSDNVFTNPNFAHIAHSSKWASSLNLDCAINPVIFLGDESDGQYLFEILRSFAKKEGLQKVIFCATGLNFHQKQMLSEQGAVYLEIDQKGFLNVLSRAFPTGRGLSEIAERTYSIHRADKQISGDLIGSFTSLSPDFFANIESATSAHGIREFYRGENVQWSDIISGITADLSQYRNWRYRIEIEMNQQFPGGKAFLLTSPAGMGKTVALMSVAFWLRRRTDKPIFWLEPDGDLRGFLLHARPDSFPSGAYIIVDDITNHIDGFDGIDPTICAQFCWILTSREARWQKYKRRFPEFIKLHTESLRKLNTTDAEEIYRKISSYGTTVYFDSSSDEERIKEILAKSAKDMLVLIRELGQGRKFDQIIRSEISDLSDVQKLVYLVVCLSDRNQVPMPLDLLAHAIKRNQHTVDIATHLKSMGRILDNSGNKRTVRTRHAIIAGHVLEPRNSVVTAGEVTNALSALLAAFSNYQTPIMVHHSNTGHARVFKTVINRKFLVDMLGTHAALSIYRRFEKEFERDGFFWQQYGLCQLQADLIEEALETLRHAYAIHDHFQIKHSLGTACLTACFKMGASLEKNDFALLRSEGRELLRELHEETKHREDAAITSLANIDYNVSRRFDNSDEFRRLREEYHRLLAFYIRDYPGMSSAKDVYNKLHASLTHAGAVAEPDFEAAFTSSYDPF